MAKRVLVLCTGNSCRSQMAAGFLRSFDSNLEVYSAGTEPADKVSSHAIAVMKEIGIDLSQERPKSVEQFIRFPFDYVITVCDEANEICPAFLGAVKHRLHMGFHDPTWTFGSEEEILAEHRRIRDEIGEAFRALYDKQLK